VILVKCNSFINCSYYIKNMQDPFQLLHGIQSVFVPNLVRPIVQGAGAMSNSAFLNTSKVPLTFINSVPKAGWDPFQQLDKHFKFEFNSSHFSNIFPSTIRVQTEVSDILIYVTCAGLSMACLLGIIGFTAMLYWKRKSHHQASSSI